MTTPRSPPRLATARSDDAPPQPAAEPVATAGSSRRCAPGRGCGRCSRSSSCGSWSGPFTAGHAHPGDRTSTRTDPHSWLQDFSDSVSSAFAAAVQLAHPGRSATSPTRWTRSFTWLQHLFTVAEFPRPLPQIGWLGVIALAGAGRRSRSPAGGWCCWWCRRSCCSASSASGRTSSTPCSSRCSRSRSSCLIGIPLGVWMGHSKAVTAIVTPVLDVMQTMPSFVYLLPFSILFGIGPAAGDHGRPSSTPAAGDPDRRARASAPSTPACSRRPRRSARAAAAAAQGRAPDGEAHDHRRRQPDDHGGAVDGHDRGVHRRSRPRRSRSSTALQRGQFGTAFVAGICIVIMAVMLDRDDDRRQRARGAGPPAPATRGPAAAPDRAGGAARSATLVALYLSHTYVWANEFPDQPDLGTPIRDARRRLRRLAAHRPLRLHDVDPERRSPNWFLNPVQSLLADVAVVRHRHRDPADRRDRRRPPRVRGDGRLPGRHLPPRPLVQRDGHADLGARRDRGGGR